MALFGIRTVTVVQGRKKSRALWRLCQAVILICLVLGGIGAFAL